MKKAVILPIAAVLAAGCAAFCIAARSGSDCGSHDKKYAGKYEAVKIVYDGNEYDSVAQNGLPVAVSKQFELREDGKYIEWDPAELKENSDFGKWVYQNGEIQLTYILDDAAKESAAPDAVGAVMKIDGDNFVISKKDQPETIYLKKVDEYITVDPTDVSAENK